MREQRPRSGPISGTPRGDFLLTTRPGGFGVFRGSPRFRAYDDVLLLVPESSRREWLDEADPALFAGPLRCFRPPRGDDRPGWEPLAGLPSRWLAPRFKAAEDLSGVALRDMRGLRGGQDARCTVLAGTSLPHCPPRAGIL